ncbi:MAG: NlpC/P60 family protein [Candidatus Zixiibacteriota bacterium]|jgi:hypothetical protein
MRFRALIILAFALAAAAAPSFGTWFDDEDWLAAVTYYQGEDAIYLDTTGKLPPQVKILAGTDPTFVVFELADVRVNPRVYTLSPRDGVVNNIRLEELKERGRRRVEVTVELAEPFRYDIERRQVESGVSQVILRLTDVNVKRVEAGGKDDVRLYARPSSDAEVVGAVSYYAHVEVLDYADEMYLVRTPEGVSGWVSEKNVKIEGDNPFKERVPPASGVRSEIIATARKYLGVPYVWGGTSPDGFDCSGLVQTVFSENGIQLPRGSGDQYREGKKISEKKMEPGDLVFFHTYTSGPSHVGIYVGEGKFLHAESSPRGVTITGLDEPYWKDRILGARTWIPE